MASTFTSSLRFTKQGDGENPNTWGEILNGVLNLVDNAVAGYTAISVGSAATVALTENQGSGDQSRSSMIHFTGSVGAIETIFAIIPNVPKAYIVRSSVSTSTSSGTFMLRVTGNTGVTIPAGSHGVYFTDGATVMTLNATGLGFTDIVYKDIGVCTTNVPDTSLADLRYVQAAVSSTITADKHFVGVSASTPGGIVIGTNARAYNPITVLTSVSACITVNFAVGNNFVVTLGANRTLKAPANATAGQTGEIYFIQDDTGSRTISFNAVYKFPSGSVPSASTSIGAVDIMVYSARSGTVIDAVMLKNFKR